MEYINELELKSLIIRIQKARKDFNTLKTGKTLFLNTKDNISNNRKINKYILWYKKIKNSKNPKKTKVLKDLKCKIIKKSECTPIDKSNHEYFGLCIMQMVDKILTKPQFRNYSYYDDFMSDSTFKILNYLDNFDHTKISKISKQPVNAFAYITQIIMNSILFVINKYKKEKKFIDEQIMSKRMELGWNVDGVVEYNVEEHPVETITFSVSSENFDKVYLDIVSCMKDSVINVVYSDNLDLDEIRSLYDLKSTFKSMKLKCEIIKEE